MLKARVVLLHTFPSHSSFSSRAIALVRSQLLMVEIHFLQQMRAERIRVQGLKQVAPAFAANVGINCIPSPIEWESIHVQLAKDLVMELSDNAFHSQVFLTVRTSNTRKHDLGFPDQMVFHRAHGLWVFVIISSTYQGNGMLVGVLATANTTVFNGILIGQTMLEESGSCAAASMEPFHKDLIDCSGKENIKFICTKGMRGLVSSMDEPVQAL